MHCAKCQNCAGEKKESVRTGKHPPCFVMRTVGFGGIILLYIVAQNTLKQGRILNSLRMQILKKVLTIGKKCGIILTWYGLPTCVRLLTA